MVNTKGVGQHLPRPDNERLGLYHSGKYCRVKTEKKVRDMDIISSYYSQTKERTNESS